MVLWPPVLLSLLATLVLPVLLAVAACGREWAGASGMALAARSALGLGILAPLLFLGNAFWTIAGNEPGTTGSVGEGFLPTFFAIIALVGLILLLPFLRF